jgi:energy-coupling factor transporter transmembrane protein EcfT
MFRLANARVYKFGGGFTFVKIVSQIQGIIFWACCTFLLTITTNVLMLAKFIYSLLFKLTNLRRRSTANEKLLLLASGGDW